MDTYASQGSTVEKRPLERVGDLERFLESVNFQRSRVRMSVEGFNHNRPEDEIESELINHFKSCGNLTRVEVPTDPVFESRAFVNFLGHKAKEKALQLDGSSIGDWKARVKYAPEEEEEENQVAVRYERSLYTDLANDKRFFFGVAVWGYDTSLPVDVIESKLRAHFSSCGVITHVYVCPPDKSTNIYFSELQGEASALDLDGSQLDGFKITTVRVATATARTNPLLAPGELKMVGYSVPAHYIEFAKEITKKLKDYMTEWRAKARREKVRALIRKQEVQGEGQGS